MTALYLASPRSYAGKSLMTLALGKDAQQRGKQVRYFKPIGPYPTSIDGTETDQDALSVIRALGIEEPLDALCPVLLTPQFHQQVLAGRVPDLLPRVQDAFRRATEGADLALVGGMGSLFSSGSAYGLTAQRLADGLDMRVLVVARYEPERTADDLLAARAFLGDRLLGATFNAVLPAHRTQATADVIPFLESRGVPIYGALPEDPILHAIPVNELVSGLNARVLTGAEYLDELVEKFVIGAMQEEAALSYFRRVPNKAVVTGGDRSDIQRSALETPTKALILTGGIYPANIILSAAAERKVPVLLVNEDTLSTIERIEGMLGHLRIRQPRKIEHALSLVQEHIDLDRLWADLG